MPEEETPAVPATDPDSGFPDAAQHHSQKQQRDETGRFTEAEMKAKLEQARTEERDKLYDRIDKSVSKDDFQQFEQQTKTLQEEVSEIKSLFQQQQEYFAKLQNPAEEEEPKTPEGLKMTPAGDGPGVDEITAKFRQELEDMQQNVNTLREERDKERVLRERESELAALETYRQEVIAANSEDIAPELAGFVQGFSKEDIDKSAEAAKTASNQIFTAIAEAQNQQQQTAVGHRAAMPTTTPYAPSGVESPLDGPQTKELTKEQIKNMPMAEYAKYRHQLISPDRSQGLYG